jgi:predicted DNA-binding transcriptional regulator AlpA
MTPRQPSGHPEMPSRTLAPIMNALAPASGNRRWGSPNNSFESQERSEMTTVDSILETLLNEHDVARITGLSVASVRRWRLLRQGPKYIKIGAAVRYRPEDVAAWLETRPSGGGEQA